MTFPQVDSFQGQQSRIALEDTYGVLPASPSWQRFSDIRLVPKSQFETEMIRGAGDEAPSGVLLNDEFTNVDISGRFGYAAIDKVLASMFGFPDVTLVSGSTYDKVYPWDGRTPVTPASYGLHYGQPGSVTEVLGMVFNGLSIGVSRGGGDHGSSGWGKAVSNISALGGVTNEVQTITITGGPTSGTWTATFRGRTTAPIQYNATPAVVQTALQALPTIGIGNVLVTGVAGAWIVTFVGRMGGLNVATLGVAGTFTGGTSPAIAVVETTPGADAATTIPNLPLAPLHFNVYMDDSWAALGTTQLLALYNLDMAWGERWQRSRPVNRLRTSDSVYGTEDQEHTVALRLGADATARALLSTIRNGSMKFVRLEAFGNPTGDASLRYEAVFDFCLLLSGTDGYDGENNIHVMNWNATIARDTVSGNASRIRIRNKTNGV